MLTDPSAKARPTSGWRSRVIQTVLVLAVLVAIFAGVIPQLVDYRGVWESLGNLSPPETLALAVLALGHFLLIWLLYVAGLPSLRVREAAVAHQASTAVANTVPAGGPLAVGVTGGMFRSWGFTYYAISRVLVVVGIWDQLARIVVPIAGAVLVAVAGDLGRTAMLGVALGVIFILTAVVVLVLLFRSDGPALWFGRTAGRVATWAARTIKRGPFDWSEQAVALRRQTVGLIRVRWPALTASAVGAQLMLAVLLYACLRAVGLGAEAASFLDVVATYSVARAISLAAPTPGGVGVVELVFIALLTRIAPADEDLIAAGVFLWRALTYLLPILGGLVGWLVWRAKASWRHEAQTAQRGVRYTGPAPEV